MKPDNPRLLDSMQNEALCMVLANRIGLPTAPVLTRKQLQRGVHRSTAELEADIMAFIAAHNENPKPYKWLKSADETLAAVKRFCQKQ